MSPDFMMAPAVLLLPLLDIIFDFYFILFFGGVSYLPCMIPCEPVRLRKQGMERSIKKDFLRV